MLFTTIIFLFIGFNTLFIVQHLFFFLKDKTKFKVLMVDKLRYLEKVLSFGSKYTLLERYQQTFKDKEHQLLFENLHYHDEYLTEKHYDLIRDVNLEIFTFPLINKLFLSAYYRIIEKEDYGHMVMLSLIFIVFNSVIALTLLNIDLEVLFVLYYIYVFVRHQMIYHIIMDIKGEYHKVYYDHYALVQFVVHYK